MLLAGDEFARTQHGNNNAYCQDNEISWLDYGRIDEHGDIHRFVRELIRLRNAHPALTRPDFFTGNDHSRNDYPDISWHNEHGNAMDWSSHQHLLALLIDGDQGETRADDDDDDFYFMYNATARDHTFTLVTPPVGGQWHRVIDTHFPSPQDILPVGSELLLEDQRHYRVRGHSLAVLLAKSVAG
jgi:glycogen operon protein